MRRLDAAVKWTEDFRQPAGCDSRRDSDSNEEDDQTNQSADRARYYFDEGRGQSKQNEPAEYGTQPQLRVLGKFGFLSKLGFQLLLFVLKLLRLSLGRPLMSASVVNDDGHRSRRNRYVGK